MPKKSVEFTPPFSRNKVRAALLKLAECVDQLEQIHFQNSQIMQRPEFRSRRQLIEEILDE